MNTGNTTSYADMSKSHREEKKFKMPNGTYKGLFKGHKYAMGKTTNNPMITLEFKPLSAPNPETLKKLNDKNRLLVKRFVFSPKAPFQFGDFLNFMEDLGVDLSTIRPFDEDPDLKDLRAYLDQAERTPFEVELETKQQKDASQYYDIKFKDVQKIFNTAPVAIPAPVVATPSPTGPTYAQMITAGWTDETLRASEYSGLVPVAPRPAPLAPPVPTSTALPVAPAPVSVPVSTPIIPTASVGGPVAPPQPPANPMG